MLETRKIPRIVWFACGAMALWLALWLTRAPTTYRTTRCMTPEQRASVPLETADLDDLTLIRDTPDAGEGHP